MKSLKKSEFHHFGKLKKRFNHWVSFLPWDSGPATSFEFVGRNFAPGSEIGSVRSGRPGPRTNDAKSDFAALAYNSRLGGVCSF